MITASNVGSADRLVRAERLRVGAIMPMAVIAACLAGVIVAKLGARSHPVLALLLPVLALPFVLWKWPRVGVYLVMGAAVTIEQFNYTVGNKHGASHAKADPAGSAAGACDGG